MIAGTYTPLCVALLDGTDRARSSSRWCGSGALAGIVFRVAWMHAPAWLYTPFYVALGWVAIAVLPSLARAGGPAVVTLVVVGGAGLQRRRGRSTPCAGPTRRRRRSGTTSCSTPARSSGYVCHYLAVALAVR